MIFYNNIILVPVCVPPLNDYKPLKPFNRSVSKLGDVKGPCEDLHCHTKALEFRGLSH